MQYNNQGKQFPINKWRQVLSNFLSFQSKDTSETPITVDDEDIECTNSLSLLGSVIDRKLNCGEHFSSEICFKANSTIFLSWMGKLFPEKTLLCLFSSVIPLELNNCSIVCLFTKASDKCKLERMQKKGLRTVIIDKKASLPNFLEQRTACFGNFDVEDEKWNISRV